MPARRIRNPPPRRRTIGNSPKSDINPAPSFARLIPVVYFSLVVRIIKIGVLAPAVLVAAYGQTSGKAAFEVASIKTSQTYLKFSDQAT